MSVDDKSEVVVAVGNTSVVVHRWQHMVQKDSLPSAGAAAAHLNVRRLRRQTQQTTAQRELEEQQQERWRLATLRTVPRMQQHSSRKWNELQYTHTRKIDKELHGHSKCHQSSSQSVCTLQALNPASTS